MSEMDDFVPGTFGCHEALHVANVLAELIESRLREHPAIKGYADWTAKAAAAAEALQELYQAIGSAHVPLTTAPGVPALRSVGHEASSDPGPAVRGTTKRS